MEKTFDVIGVEDLIMDFALQIARIPKTDGMASSRTAAGRGEETPPRRLWRSPAGREMRHGGDDGK